MATITGTTGNNTLNGTINADIIYGKDGNDLIKGGDGADTLYGDNGNDTVYGGNGNDIVKGGYGVSKLYGEAGDDKLYYNPYKGNLGDDNLITKPAVDALAASFIDGGANNDTLYLFNEGFYFPNDLNAAAETQIVVNSAGVGEITFGEFEMDFMYAPVGKYQNIERVEVSGGGRLEYLASASTKAATVIGTKHNDTFKGGSGNERFEGGAGNDIFNGGHGNDTLVSLTTDSDTLIFDVLHKGADIVKGFNGAGVAGGDMLTFLDSRDGYIPLKITESATAHTTKFEWTNTAGTASSVTVDAIGLKAGIDYQQTDMFYYA